MATPRVLAFGATAPLIDLLRANGYEVMRAPGRSRALGLAKDLLPELLLVEAGTDLASAEELIGLLSADGVTRLLPIVCVVANRDAALVGRALDAGANDVVTLEADSTELLARVGAALRAKRAMEDLVAEKQRVTLLELAGAVAHKINQPLTAMSVIVETLIASHRRSDLSIDRLGTKLDELQPGSTLGQSGHFWVELYQRRPPLRFSGSLGWRRRLASLT